MLFASKVVGPNSLGGARTFATLKEISLRLKSVKNISKITKSMKMIASTKLARAQKGMEVGRVFGQSSSKLLASLKAPDAAAAANAETAKKLVVVCSSDRGLCGAIHSSVSKVAKKIARSNPGTGIVVLGDKAKPQIAREARKNIVAHFNQIGKAVPTYADALVIAQRVQAIREQDNFSDIVIVYNHFKSVIAYDTKTMLMRKPEEIYESEDLIPYELEEDKETLNDYIQYQLINSIYWGLVESHASEMSAKRTAMENATKNAGEMIEVLTMKFNRTRQAVITNELCDIITGASAL